jgi:hypothetical protein
MLTFRSTVASLCRNIAAKLPIRPLGCFDSQQRVEYTYPALECKGDHLHFLKNELREAIAAGSSMSHK